MTKPVFVADKYIPGETYIVRQFVPGEAARLVAELEKIASVSVTMEDEYMLVWVDEGFKHCYEVNLWDWIYFHADGTPYHVENDEVFNASCSPMEN